MPSSVRALAVAVMVVAATALFVLVLRCSDSVEATLAAQQRAAPAALPLPLTTGRDGLPRINTSQRVPGSVRLVLLSDTHTHHSELVVPDGDILIHAGAAMQASWVTGVTHPCITGLLTPASSPCSLLHQRAATRRPRMMQCPDCPR